MWAFIHSHGGIAIYTCYHSLSRYRWDCLSTALFVHATPTVPFLSNNSGQYSLVFSLVLISCLSSIYSLKSSSWRKVLFIFGDLIVLLLWSYLMRPTQSKMLDFWPKICWTVWRCLLSNLNWLLVDLSWLLHWTSTGSIVEKCPILCFG